MRAHKIPTPAIHIREIKRQTLFHGPLKEVSQRASQSQAIALMHGASSDRQPTLVPNQDDVENRMVYGTRQHRFANSNSATPVCQAKMSSCGQ
jgi:hypothetical protein